MHDFLLSILEKLLDWLISLRVKPSIKIVNFSIDNGFSDNKQRIRFTAIISNNSNRNMSISEKYLSFYQGKELLHRIPVTKYEIVRKKDGFDKFNILMPIDDIIMLNAGESKKVSILDEKENLNIVSKVIFTYYTGRRMYRVNIKR